MERLSYITAGSIIIKEETEVQSSLPAVITLMYHRINVIDTDPWGICVSPNNFEEQVKFLKNNFNLISTHDLINQIKNGNITANSICVTFDDGYADNYAHAKPILEKNNCPATFFIATAFINECTPFWWDELEIILLHSKQLNGKLCLQIEGEEHEYTFNKSGLTTQQWQQHINWKWYDEPLTDRCAAFLDIWKKLRPLSYKEIKNQMAAIRNWAGNNIAEQRLPMNEQQLYELSKNNLFTIGMHTHTHPDLRTKEKHVQEEEIVCCKKLLADKYNIENNSLAYPYGSYNNQTIKAAAALQISACFTTEPGKINVNSNLMKLKRCQVFDWDIDTFKGQLNKWISNI